MGSSSDLSLMQEARSILEEFRVPYAVRILSAHRTPEATFRFARLAESNGFKVLIAGAGGAAHLPGVLAALTNLPVVGIPIRSKSFRGIDSLLSIIQMPAGVPVATMAVDGAKNAALFACRILALHDKRLQKVLRDFKSRMKRSAQLKVQSLELKKI